MAKITHNVSTPNDGLGDALRTSFVNQNSMNTELYDNKVDKIDGLGLSENDLTDALLTKLNNLNGLPTLQEVLDYNHDLVDGNNFQGTGAGIGNTGVKNNGFGDTALKDNTGNNVNANGQSSGKGNIYDNVNLFGQFSTADANNQTVFAKDDSNQVRISFDHINGFKKVEMPDKDGTFAYLDDLPSTVAGGDLTGSYPNPAVLNSAVLAKLLTGLNVTGSSIVNTDNLLEAFGKLQNQINGVLGGAIYQGVYNAFTNTPTLANGTGIKGYYYVVSVAGVQNLGSGNIDFNIGDWAIYNGTIWQKVDNTDAVTSVNGFIGAVNLTSANITEVTNLYFTTARAIASQLTGYVSGPGTVSATDTILQSIQKLNGNISALTTASVPDSTNKRYVTDSQLVILGNTSNVNSGDDARTAYKTADFTAVNGFFYIVGGTGTIITDPTGVVGQGYIVYVSRGSAVIGGVAIVDQSVIYRFYTSVGWTSKDITNATALSNKVEKSFNGLDFASVKELRANIGIENISNAGNADFTIPTTAKVVITNVAITLPRNWTLPLANSFNPGQEVIFADFFGTVTSTNTITVVRSGTDLINGAVNVVIGASYGMRRLISDGVSKWTFDAGVMRISDYIGTTLTASKVVVTDANNKLAPSAVTVATLNFLDATSSVQTQINTKQPTLVSGTNVKTINGNSIVGSGDLAIAAGGTVTSVTGANGVTVATGTTTPVIGLGSITVTGLAITGGSTANFLLGNGGATSFATAVRGVVLTGFVAGTNTVITAANTLLIALQNLQGQISSFFQSLRGTVSVAATAQTTFTVTFGGTQPNNTYFVGITPLNTTTAAQNFIMTKTTTSFTVSFLTGITGTVNFDWVLHQ